MDIRAHEIRNITITPEILKLQKGRPLIMRLQQLMLSVPPRGTRLRQGSPSNASLPCSAESTAHHRRSGTVVFVVIRVAATTPTMCAIWVPEVSYASRV